MLNDMYFEEYQQKIFDREFKSTVDAAIFLEEHYLPVRCRGKLLMNYYVDAKGNIFSVKKGYNSPTKLLYNYNSTNYPKIRIDVSSEDMIYPVWKTVLVHRLVCESFHKQPIPDGVTEEEWKKTPKSVKNCFNDYWEVNHIDHNTYNYHPSNLEWVSRQQNIIKYQNWRYNDAA